MPGFSTECVSGNHPGCTMGVECRCDCHHHTKVLRAKGPGKPDPKGGIRRVRLKKNIAEAVAEIPEVPAIPEVPIVCGQCSASCKTDDTFCFKCGNRLQGKECVRCGLSGESEDVFCRKCGWKYGEAIQAEVVPSNPTTETLKQQLRDRLARSQAAVVAGNGELPVTEIPEEDPLIRLKRKAIEQGVLKA